ncbi:hypothetical protein [Methanoculleus frigidifontis]|uniref:hypothetical protein n=1 Tax=Methanoculleus frigidifontis TaxID=2584085 RepID=UPI003464A39E
MVTFCGSDISLLADDPARFAKAVFVNRNNLTHHDPSPARSTRPGRALPPSRCSCRQS